MDVEHILRHRTRQVVLKRYATESFFQLVSRTIEELEFEHPNMAVNLIEKNEQDTTLLLDGVIDLGFSREIMREGLNQAA